jgi:hypothetical protein
MPHDPYLSYARRSPRKRLWYRARTSRAAMYAVRFANRPPSQTAVITGIAMALVLAALTVPPVQYTLPRLAPPAGWETFSTAVAAVTPLVADTPGGPWNVSLAEGVAASGPWSPTLSMWGLNGTRAATVSECQSLLSGPSVFTFWNDSEYPQATGPAVFESGGAGLWSFVFLNSSGGALVLSVLRGEAQVNGIVPRESACAQIGGPFRAPTSYLDLANASDPSQFASSSYQWLTSAQPSVPSGSAAFYILGNPAVPFAFYAPGYNQEWSTYYGTCGAPGVNGRVTYDGAPQAIPFRPGFMEQVTVGNYCYQSMDALLPGEKSLWSSQGAFYASWPLSVLLDSSTRPVSASPSPLSTALFQLAVGLNSSKGPYSFSFNSGQPRCSPGAPSVSWCLADPQSWYAVLLGVNGTVVNTFPAYAGDSAWTVANTTIVQGDELVLVSSVPAFSLQNSGLEFISGWTPYICCGIDFGPSTQAVGAPFEL